MPLSGPKRWYLTAERDVNPERGFPDYPVAPTIEDLLQGTDTIMEFAIALIEKES